MTCFRLLCGTLLFTLAVTASAQDGRSRNLNIYGSDKNSRSLTVTMTNNSSANSILVYDTKTHALIQTLSTHGLGGVAGNARGVRQFNNSMVAVVNNGSNTVSTFVLNSLGTLVLNQTISVISPPVSIDFANNHMYVAEATSTESFLMNGNSVLQRDGRTNLILAGGGPALAGDTAQIGVVSASQLLVTLKTDPTPGTVDVIALNSNGAIMSTAQPVSAPMGSLTPFGFSVLTDGTALITLAHSNDLGLFRNGAFISVIKNGSQVAPCWTTKVGKYVMAINTGSMTISREISTGNNIFIDNQVAASITTGGNPTDSDANGGYQVVLDHTTSDSHLSFFTVNKFGELTADQSPVSLGVSNPNGVAILVP